MAIVVKAVTTCCEFASNVAINTRHDHDVTSVNDDTNSVVEILHNEVTILPGDEWRKVIFVATTSVLFADQRMI